MGNKLEDGNLTRKGAGRPKGSLNRTTKVAKDVINDTANKLGGSDRLLDWTREDPKNESDFWTKIYPKLLPLTLSGDPDNPIETITKVLIEPMKK